MTPETRAMLEAVYAECARDAPEPMTPAAFLSDQQLVAEYLDMCGVASPAEYAETMGDSPEFLAVLATAEYHQHFHGTSKTP